MALVAFDFMGRDVGGMNEVCFFITVKPVLFPVAFITIFPWHNAVTKGDLNMAALAGEIILESYLMVIAGFVLQEVFWLVAMITISDSGIMLALLKVANKTGTFSNRNMFPLNNLGVATRATELFPSAQVFEMNFMVENNGLEFNPAFKQPSVMTARP